MFNIYLKNGKKFVCDEDSTILDAAKKNKVLLEHSCLSYRCRSCMVKLLSGKTKNVEEEFVLTEKEKNSYYVLSCNAVPVSDLKLDVEDLGNITFYEKKITPSKINLIEKLTSDIIRVVLRIPPNSNFNFISGQYVNITREKLTRSYSIASCSSHKNQLEFFIKKYETGLMSDYFFKEAKTNDLLRLEGPLGTFFFRDSDLKNIVFLATGTGIAPIKSILEGLDKEYEKHHDKIFLIIVGARYKQDLFWEPDTKNLNIKHIQVLSRPEKNWDGSKGYVQDILLNQQIDLKRTQVYACGSFDMINSAKKILLENNLLEANFFSDAFIQTN